MSAQYKIKIWFNKYLILFKFLIYYIPEPSASRFKKYYLSICLSSSVKSIKNFAPGLVIYFLYYIWHNLSLFWWERFFLNYFSYYNSYNDFLSRFNFFAIYYILSSLKISYYTFVALFFKFELDFLYFLTYCLILKSPAIFIIIFKIKLFI